MKKTREGMLLCAIGLSMVCMAAASVVKVAPATCPLDYRRRVETCVMEAQMAPQAGGGITLVVNKDKIVDLCDRGLLVKTIDCLKEIRERCSHNITILHELDLLYNVGNWHQGAQLLCSDTDLFQNNFECISRTTSSVMTCFLMRTQIFRMQMGFTRPENHPKLREVTCSFAEGVVKCLRGPLESQCPEELGKRLAESMQLFLPPFCHSSNSTDQAH